MEEADYSKSEQATPYKLKRAREQGNVARGTDLGVLAGLSAVLGVLWASGHTLEGRVEDAARWAFAVAPGLANAPDSILAASGRVLTSAFRPLAILGGSVFLIVLLFEMVQTGIVFSTHPLKPDFNRLNPANGLKRLFSPRLLMETGKTLVKFLLFSGISILVIRDVYEQSLLAMTDGNRLWTAMTGAAYRLAFFFAIGGILIVAIDQFIARREFGKKMRMSRRELRKEHRDREGEPRLKQKRKKLHAEFAKMSQSMRNVKDADFLVVNPTHYAVALKYVPAQMTAPKVTAMGRDAFALRLKRIAFTHGVIIVSDRNLARDLYRHCVLDRQIPDPFYSKVAQLYIDRNNRRLAAAGLSTDESTDVRAEVSDA